MTAAHPAAQGEAQVAAVAVAPRAVELIGRKRDGLTLTRDELATLIGGYLAGDVMEGQMAAFLMAGVLNGFDESEARALTEVLVASGEVLDLTGLGELTVDKHSTGGVGDGTTLLVAPLLAAAGATVVKLSGRGLGHSGGTLDKLEAIPGLQVALDRAALLRVARDVGCVVAAQTDALVPADRALYALRDVTGTVASTALIASSVMSKKLAAGARTVVLDVKAGDGAFMATYEDARALAALCVAIGTEAGRRTVGVVSSMDSPLGRGIGNALEVAEAVALLSQPAPWLPSADGQTAGSSRLADVALILASIALGEATGAPEADARAQLERQWASGAALGRLQAMVAAQGGDPRVCEDPWSVLPVAPVRREVAALAGGTVVGLPAKAVGELAVTLGAGRARKDDPVDPAVGIELHVDLGDTVAPGQPVATIHARTEEDAEFGAALLAPLFGVDHPQPVPPTVLDVVRA